MTSHNCPRCQCDETDAPGAWIAYYSDYSALVLFGDELSALRYAVAHDMKVKFVEYGEGIR